MKALSSPTLLWFEQAAEQQRTALIPPWRPTVRESTGYTAHAETFSTDHANPPRAVLRIGVARTFRPANTPVLHSPTNSPRMLLETSVNNLQSEGFEHGSTRRRLPPSVRHASTLEPLFHNKQFSLARDATLAPSCSLFLALSSFALLPCSLVISVRRDTETRGATIWRWLSFLRTAESLIAFPLLRSVSNRASQVIPQQDSE